MNLQLCIPLWMFRPIFNPCYSLFHVLLNMFREVFIEMLFCQTPYTQVSLCKISLVIEYIYLVASICLFPRLA